MRNIFKKPKMICWLACGLLAIVIGPAIGASADGLKFNHIGELKMRVLLATDGSEHAEHAANLLARLPHSQPLELAILAVTPPIGFHGSIDVVEWMQRSQEAEKQQVAEACRRIVSQTKPQMCH